MRELRRILDTARHLAARGEEGVLATVVKVEGSTYRRPGARLLISRGGEVVGGVSGGCLEGDLVRKAWWRTTRGPTLVTYDSAADGETAWQLGLGCNGVVHVLLERVTPKEADPLAFVRRCVDAGKSGVLATVIRADSATGAAVGDRMTLDSCGLSTGDFDEELADRVRADAADCLASNRARAEVYALPCGEVEVAFEVVRPPLRLLVFGAGFDAVPVVTAGKALGWRVIVMDNRPGTVRQAAFANADEVLFTPPQNACDRLRPDSRTAAVVMSHSFPQDAEAVGALIRTPARYIGVLGPRARTEKLLARLPDPKPALLDRLYAPIGLDVGADTPEEIAAAIVAEVTAVFAGRPAGHLRDRPGAIHRREESRVAEAVP